jgi:hypothetical protein
LPVNDPVALAGVTAAFERYERALNDNDVAVLDELFLDAPHTVRYGLREQLYGHAEIAGFRAAREPIDLRRVLTKVVITTYGLDFAVASCEYRRIGSGRQGRQMQTWLRTESGWQVAAAHVSYAP